MITLHIWTTDLASWPRPFYYVWEMWGYCCSTESIYDMKLSARPFLGLKKTNLHSELLCFTWNGGNPLPHTPNASCHFKHVVESDIGGRGASRQSHLGVNPRRVVFKCSSLPEVSPVRFGTGVWLFCVWRVNLCVWGVEDVILVTANAFIYFDESPKFRYAKFHVCSACTTPPFFHSICRRALVDAMDKLLGGITAPA